MSGDKIQNRLEIHRRTREMTSADIDDNGDLATEFLVPFFRDPRVVIEGWVEASAHVQQRHAGLGERGEIVKEGHSDGRAAENGILGINTGCLIWILDGPRI